jgi:hypothetical protein
LHNIPIDFKVTNENDSKAMGTMLRSTKTILVHNNFTAIYDKAYHTGSEFDYANRLGVAVLVTIPGVSAHAPDLAFDVDHSNTTKPQIFTLVPQMNPKPPMEIGIQKKWQVNNPNEALQNQCLFDL